MLVKKSMTFCDLEKFAKTNLNNFILLRNPYIAFIILEDKLFILQTSSFNSTLDGHARECNKLSTGVILLADIIPGLLIKAFSPFFPLYAK